MLNPTHSPTHSSLSTGSANPAVLQDCSATEENKRIRRKMIVDDDWTSDNHFQSQW